MIAANRALLAALVATNFLGQNTPAIAANEATYAEFWAQDAGAMYGYAGAATTASQLTPFAGPRRLPTTADRPPSRRRLPARPPRPRIRPPTDCGVPDPAEHRNHAIRHPARVAQLGSRDPFSARGGTDGLALVGHERHHGYREGNHHLHQHRQHLRRRALVRDRTREPDEELVPGRDQYPQPGVGIQGIGPLLNPHPIVGALSPLLHSGLLSGSYAGGGNVGALASAGRAGTIGALSVPQSWASAVPAVRTVAAEMNATAVDAAPEMAAIGQNGMFGQTALASLAGRALGGPPPARSRVRATACRVLWRPTTSPPPPPSS